MFHLLPGDAWPSEKLADLAEQVDMMVGRPIELKAGSLRQNSSSIIMP